MIGYDDSKDMLGRVRMLMEGTSDSARESDYIAITDDPKFGEKKLSEQKNMVISALQSSVEFKDEPLRYYPETGDLTFMGTIADMNNLFFEFRLLSGVEGVYVGIPADSFVQLTSVNIDKIQKLSSLSKTWHENWTSNSELLNSYKRLTRDGSKDLYGKEGKEDYAQIAERLMRY